MRVRPICWWKSLVAQRPDRLPIPHRRSRWRRRGRTVASSNRAHAHARAHPPLLAARTHRRRRQRADRPALGGVPRRSAAAGPATVPRRQVWCARVQVWQSAQSEACDIVRVEIRNKKNGKQTFCFLHMLVCAQGFFCRSYCTRLPWCSLAAIFTDLRVQFNTHYIARSHPPAETLSLATIPSPPPTREFKS